jgi:hypothetical protein
MIVVVISGEVSGNVDGNTFARPGSWSGLCSSSGLNGNFAVFLIIIFNNTFPLNDCVRSHHRISVGGRGLAFVNFIEISESLTPSFEFYSIITSR